MSEERNDEVLETEEVNERLIELTDEETGEAILFEHLDTIEKDGVEYFVLTEYFEDEAEEQEENDVYVMTVVELENGEETLEIVEDDALVMAIFEEFKERCDGEFEFLD